MHATRIMSNLRVADIEAAKSFYTDYLGLSKTGQLPATKSTTSASI
jgi:catechol 2,3-dioxygenase-like lactoylglutathione lyase family enzyme